MLHTCIYKCKRWPLKCSWMYKRHCLHFRLSESELARATTCIPVSQNPEFCTPSMNLNWSNSHIDWSFHLFHKNSNNSFDHNLRQWMQVGEKVLKFQLSSLNYRQLSSIFDSLLHSNFFLHEKLSKVLHVVATQVFLQRSTVLR